MIVWDLCHAVKVCELKGHGSFPNAVAWHPTVPGLVATASDDHSVRLWHTKWKLSDTATTCD